jgi:DNA-binding transcriptional LysR family regulator
MSDDFDLNLLRIFVAVAETESFSKAAHQLGMPRPTVSRAIARLEEAAGARLLQRTTRKVALSTTGTAFYERIAPKLVELQSALIDMPEIEEPASGRLRISAPVDFGSAVFAEIASRFVCRYPSIQLDVNITNERVDLVTAGFDAALRISTKPLKDSTLSAKNLGPFVIQIFASPQYLSSVESPRTPQDTEGHRWVLFRQPDKTTLLGPDGARATITMNGRLRCDEMFFLREAIRSGAGLGLLPTFIADPLVSSGDLVPVLPRWAIRSGSIWFVSPSAKQMPKKVILLRDLITETLRVRPLHAG